jgi:hypothetical protein
VNGWLVNFWETLFLTTKKTLNSVYVPLVQPIKDQASAITFFVHEAKPKKKPPRLGVFAPSAPFLRNIRWTKCTIVSSGNPQKSRFKHILAHSS